MLNYLDHVQRQIEALPFPDEVKKAAVRQEALRRRPELLQGKGCQAAVMRALMLTCAVALSKVDDHGQAAVAAVRDILRKAYRASSLVECINSVLRMQQARHRKMTQGLLDLKRLVLELPHLRHRPPSRDHPLPKAGCALAGRHALVGCAQINT